VKLITKSKERIAT